VTGWETVVLVGAAGLAAGTINTVVGSGTLITFPILLALGVPPVTANVSNTLGLVPGSFSGAWSYRRELTGQRDRLVRLGSASVLGGIIGALLLLILPAGVFTDVVPVLIVLALALVVAQPWLARRLAGSGHHPSSEHGAAAANPALLWSLVLLTGIYGGYFGAANGVILIAILGTLVEADLQRMNALKNMLIGMLNAVAGLVFILLAHPDWTYVAIIAVGATLGGQIGGFIGRRLSPMLLRAFIVVVGTAALIKFLVS
jgi:uncharacterized membrane protein YfcA